MIVVVFPLQIVALVVETETDGEGFTVSVKFVGPLVPHGNVAVTEIIPLVDPAVTLIEFVPCPELIVDPEGTVQV